MKFKRVLLVFSLLLCILFSIACVVASDANDTQITGEVEGSLVAGDVEDVEIAGSVESQVIGQADDDLIEKTDNGNFTELQIRIALASEGSTIDLDKDYSYSAGSNIDTGIIINSDLTIDGHGHTIDGMSKSRIFTIFYGIKDNTDVTLKNIIFKNGVSKIYGGAILNFGNLIIDNCTFINNYAHTAGGAINSLGSLNLMNSKFSNNLADGDAGAVFSLNIKNSFDLFKSLELGLNSTGLVNTMLSIAMNTSLDFGKDYISNCKFTNNVANGTGGGAVYAFSDIDINSCKFYSNKAGKKGGAVFGNKDLFIKNSKFKKNTAGMYGGAVYFRCHEQSGHYENGAWVPSIKFYSNLIENSGFSKNVAGERGGAIYGFKANASDNVHCAKAVKCVFTDNRSPKGNEIYGGTLTKCTLDNTKISLEDATVKKSAKKLVLKAKLKKGSDALKNKKVTFKFNGIKYNAKTNSKGIAKVTIKSKVLKSLEVGQKVKYQAKYKWLVDKKKAKVKK